MDGWKKPLPLSVVMAGAAQRPMKFGKAHIPPEAEGRARAVVFEHFEVGMCNRPSEWSKTVKHHILVYQYRLCYTMPLYCTGTLSRSVT